MKNNLKRFLTLALALVMVLSVSPMAFAEGSVEETPGEAVPPLPTATVTKIENPNYTVAMSFKADELTEDQLAEYANWTADFVMTVNADVKFGEGGNALAGQYTAYSNDWIEVPTVITAKAGEEIEIIENIASLMGGATTVDFGYVYNTVKEFKCGAYFTPAFLQANPDLEVTLKLVMTSPEGEKETIGNTLTFNPEFVIPEAPTATAAKVQDDELTFAMKFTADTPTADQLAYYGDWEADFVLSVNKTMNLNANGKKDGYLAGQYDAWSADWVKVPAGEDVELSKDGAISILKYAQTAMGTTEFKGVTYREVVEKVKVFNCGMFVSPEFLAANRDLTATLKLVIENPESGEGITIGTYSFSAATPALPTATVKEISAEDTTFAMEFTAVQPSEAQLAYFGDWYADYVMTVNKPMTLNANGKADGYLAGSYQAWNDGEWVKLPLEDLALTSGQSVRIMQFNAANMGNGDTNLTYNDVLKIGTFNCGLYLTPEYLKANAGLEVMLQLRLYNPEYESEFYVIGETYSFKETQVEVNGEVANGTVAEILEKTETGTVSLVKDASTNENIMVEDEVTLDLSGNTLTSTGRLTVYGDLVDNSADKSGLLVIDKDKLVVSMNNPQLPVYTGEGYKFFTITKFNTKEMIEGVKFAFQPLFEQAAIDYLLKGQNATGVVMQVKVSWFDANNGTEITQTFTYTDALVKQYLESYNAETGKYDKAFTLTLTNTNGIQGLSFSAVVTNPGVVSTNF